MGVSFKVSRMGTRYMPKPPVIEDDGDDDDNGSLESKQRAIEVLDFDRFLLALSLCSSISQCLIHGFFVSRAFSCLDFTSFFFFFLHWIF